MLVLRGLNELWRIIVYLWRTFWHFLRDIPRHGMRGLFWLGLLLETLLTILIVGVDDDYFVVHIQPHLQNFARSDSRLVSLILPRIVIKPSETVWRADVQVLEAAAKLAGYDDWSKYFHEQGIGFRPATNSLRFLSMPEQYMPRAQLSGVPMQGVDLFAAQ